MEWLQDWILKIAGVIVLGALCDMLVPKGEIKKYVNFVTGLVLVIATIGLFSNASFDVFGEFEEAQTRRRAIEFQNSLSDKERFEIIKLYRVKLAESIKNEICAKGDDNIEVKVEVEEKNEEKFGEITAVTVIFKSDAEQEEECEKIKKTICEKYGVDKEAIRMVTLSE